MSMTSRERVIAVLRGNTPDRIPVYGWVAANLSEPIAKLFGSVAEFEDHYAFDFAHLFGGPSTYDGSDLKDVRASLKGPITPQALLDVPVHDPNDLEGCLRLEISGTSSLDRGRVNSRLQQKLKQLSVGRSNLPALAAVVGFGARIIVLAILELQ